MAARRRRKSRHIARPGSRILVKDVNGRHDVKLALVTTDIAEAVRDAELILCPAPAFAQADIAQTARAASARRPGGVPAAGDLRLDDFCAAPRMTPAIAPMSSFAETGTLPWLTRKHGPFEVAITIRAKRLPVGVFPLDERRPCARRDRPRLSRRDRALRRCAVRRADECRPDHPSAADRDECRADRAFRALGHPQGRHAGRDPPRHRRARCRTHRRARGARLWRAAFSAGASLRQRRRDLDVWPRLARPADRFRRLARADSC